MSWQATTAVTRHSKHSGSELLCLLMLANYADAHGESIRPSITSLAADCRMSRRGVQYIMAKLLESGELAEAGSWANNVNIYRIVLPDMGPQAVQSLRSHKSQAVQNRTQAVQKTPPSCAIAVAHNQYEQSEKDPNEKILIESAGSDILIERWKVNQCFLRDESVFFGDGTPWINPPPVVRCNLPVRS